MNHPDELQAELNTSIRILIACVGCKIRKRRCDGRTPKCSNCVLRGVDCSYATIRRTRGPAKRKHVSLNAEEQTEYALELSKFTSKPADSGTSLLENQPCEQYHSGTVVTNSTPLITGTPTEQSPTHLGAQNIHQLFPEFLHPDSFDENLRAFKRIISETTAPRSFTPLLPYHISMRLVENSFTDVMAEHRLLGLQSLVTIIDAQYTAGSLDPAGDFARWALVNSILALALRAKTAPGSEAVLFDITYGFYQNATKVLPELLLQEPTLLSIQALLAMAMFVRHTQDAQAFVMLATNASRQLELLSLLPNRVIHMGEADQHERLYVITNTFDITISQMLNKNNSVLLSE